jgi:AraC-like DNA-binding protein
MLQKSQIPKLQLAIAIFAIILHIFILSSCENKESFKYPNSLTKAIDLFYVENQNKKVLVELQNTLTNNPDTNTKLLCYIIEAAAICESEDYDNASYHLNKIDTIPIFKNTNLKFWYKSTKGLILFRQNKLLASYAILVETVDNKNFETRAIALNQRLLARICFTLGENKKGIEWLLKSSENFKKTGLLKSIAINNKILGRYFMNDGNYLNAFKNYKSAEKEILAANDIQELYYIYINLSDYYIKVNNFEKAKYYACLVLNTYKNYNDHQIMALGYNKLGEIEFWQKNYSLSNTYFQNTLSLGSDYNSSSIRRTNSNLGLCQNYKALNQPHDALKYAKTAQELASKSGVILLQYDANLNLAKCYNSIGNTKLAYLYQDSAIQYRDSIFKEAALSTKAFYDTQKDLMKITSDMESLKQKEKKQRTAFLIFIFLLTLVIVFTLVVYTLQHSKNRVLKELVKKNLEIIEDDRKLSANLHHQIPLKKNTRKPAENDKLESLYNSLICFLETDKRFIQKDLTIEIIAKELNTNRDYLSKSINENQIKFNDLINKYRVQEAIKIMTNNSQLKLSFVSDMVGFNSNSVFIDAFKKQTGMNPAQFRASARSVVKDEKIDFN